MKHSTVQITNKSHFIEIKYLAYGGKTVLYKKYSPNKRNNCKFRCK